MHSRFSSGFNGSYAIKKISLKHVYGKRQNEEASQTEISDVIIAKPVRKKGQLPGLDIDEINAGYDRAVANQNIKFNKRAHNDYSDQVTMTILDGFLHLIHMW